jgi:hypothetical protein
VYRLSLDDGLEMTVTVPWKIKRVYDCNATTETPFMSFCVRFFVTKHAIFAEGGERREGGGREGGGRWTAKRPLRTALDF